MRESELARIAREVTDGDWEPIGLVLTAGDVVSLITALLHTAYTSNPPTAARAELIDMALQLRDKLATVCPLALSLIDPGFWVLGVDPVTGEDVPNA
jgi:hypothetical protein